MPNIYCSKRPDVVFDKKRTFPIQILLNLLLTSILILPFSACLSIDPSSENRSESELEQNDQNNSGMEATQIEEGLEILKEVEALMITGTEESLSTAYERLRRTGVAVTEKGGDYALLAYELLKVFYPSRADTLPPADSAGKGEAALWLSEVRTGIIPESPAIQNISFFYYLVSGLVVVHSDNYTLLEQAASHILKAMDIEKNSPLTYLCYGLIQRKLENINAAEGAFLQALELDPANYTAAYNLGEIYINRKDYPSAYSVLSRFSSRDEKILFLLMAKVYTGQELYSKARPYIEQYLLMSPGDIEGAIIGAQVYEGLQETDLQKPLLEKIRMSGRRDPVCFLLLARYEIFNRKMLNALEIVEDGLELYRDHRKMKDLYAEILIEIGRVREGTSLLQDSLKEDPEQIRNLILLYDQAISRNSLEDAEHLLIRLVELDPSISIMNMAINFYRDTEDYMHALELAIQVEATYPSPEAALIRIGLLFETEQTDEGIKALNDFLEAVNTPELRAEALFLLSTAVVEEEKIETLQKALLESSVHVPTLRALADLYYDSGDFSRARFYYLQLRYLLPEDKEIISRLEAISQSL